MTAVDDPGSYDTRHDVAPDERLRVTRITVSLLAGWLVVAFVPLMLRLDVRKPAIVSVTLHVVDVLVAIAVATAIDVLPATAFGPLMFAVLSAAWQLGFSGTPHALS